MKEEWREEENHLEASTKGLVESEQRCDFLERNGHGSIDISSRITSLQGSTHSNKKNLQIRNCIIETDCLPLGQAIKAKTTLAEADAIIRDILQRRGMVFKDSGLSILLNNQNGGRFHISSASKEDATTNQFGFRVNLPAWIRRCEQPILGGLQEEQVHQEANSTAVLRALARERVAESGQLKRVGFHGCVLVVRAGSD